MNSATRINWLLWVAVAATVTLAIGSVVYWATSLRTAPSSARAQVERACEQTVNSQSFDLVFEVMDIASGLNWEYRARVSNDDYTATVETEEGIVFDFVNVGGVSYGRESGGAWTPAKREGPSDLNPVYNSVSCPDLAGAESVDPESLSPPNTSQFRELITSQRSGEEQVHQTSDFWVDSDNNLGSVDISLLRVIPGK